MSGFSLGYVPEPLDEETVDLMTRDMSKNMMAILFQQVLPDFHNEAKRLINIHAEEVSKNNMALGKKFEDLQVGNSDAVDIFVDYFLESDALNMSGEQMEPEQEVNLESNRESGSGSSTELDESNIHSDQRNY